MALRILCGFIFISGWRRNTSRASGEDVENRDNFSWNASAPEPLEPFNDDVYFVQCDVKPTATSSLGAIPMDTVCPSGSETSDKELQSFEFLSDSKLNATSSASPQSDPTVHPPTLSPNFPPLEQIGAVHTK